MAWAETQPRRRHTCGPQNLTATDPRLDSLRGATAVIAPRIAL
jgi:hypothetical protein